MTRHEKAKKEIELALRKEFFIGRDADWGSAYILSLSGGDFCGLFICDLSRLDGSTKLVLMYRYSDEESGRYEDTDIIHFDSEKENVNTFIEKLKVL